ncbi:MAG TPA: hypothetical protein VJM12_12860 [Pyrinomonadaceae bacterium]|nr:hypothetical protein [Pyrinomonadaceae bacterium]
MSEVKLNLIDSQQLIQGTIHSSVVDRCVAALSAEPETIAELEAALPRYMKPVEGRSPFETFKQTQEVDDQPWDAGVIIIDLAARIVAFESSCSQPGATGQVDYHDGENATDVIVLYRVADDWLFLNSIQKYEQVRTNRVQRRLMPRLDARAVLYGKPLLEFISNAVSQASARDPSTDESDLMREAIIKEIHSQWLTTPRDDLGGKSPRALLLEKQDFIDYDLHSRSLQWSFQGEGPPCLGLDSFAYRFAGFGTHEWVVYYDLLRYLIAKAFEHLQEPGIERLEEFKRDWLESPQPDYGGRTPAILIQSERRRLPITISGRELIIDEACPMCQMMASETESGREVTFWHLDGSHMDDEFVFSPFLTRDEWDADRREWKAFTEKFNREWEQRHQAELQGKHQGDEPMCEADAGSIQ